MKLEAEYKKGLEKKLPINYDQKNSYMLNGEEAELVNSDEHRYTIKSYNFPDEVMIPDYDGRWEFTLGATPIDPYDETIMYPIGQNCLINIVIHNEDIKKTRFHEKWHKRKDGGRGKTRAEEEHIVESYMAGV